MKKSNCAVLLKESAQYVIAHSKFKSKRGKGKKPSATFRDIRNPNKALIAASHHLEMINNLKVGATIQRVMRDRQKLTKWDAKVLDITDDSITCEMIVDMPRVGKFRISDGVSILGIDYGWVE